MIGSLRGTILHRQDNWAIVETDSGVGYRVFVGGQNLSPTEPILLYTHHHVREDSDDLYGFTSVEDLMVFEMLLSVSGVGPKMAQAIQSSLGPQTIAEAVASHQSAVFKSVSGVGQKVADKIVLELKGKITGNGSLGMQGTQNGDFFEALLGLGYHQNEIVGVMKDLDPALSTEDRLKQALRLLKK